MTVQNGGTADKAAAALDVYKRQDEEEQVYVGETARERMALYPDSAADVFKRSMGSCRKYRLGKKEFTAEELSSFILRSLKEDAESFLGEEVTEAVISVPADVYKRQAPAATAALWFPIQRSRSPTN